MNLTPQQQSVLLALTTEWQTPAQIADQLQVAPENLSDVNQSLKELLHEGLAQVNPVVFGLYRLTALGTHKKAEVCENQ
ncbi:MarR family transcriptional regulator [Paenibacillus ginsengarvi]|uniref:MarR family transcriptional regulator n=1 Tax=Paenibacillus ginsengarvi TaxID=400777 RepID=A0A3B0BCR6_9BACL|nr:MarR family transcriptional regulator [Paenibacillus ginsengarvi]RKN70560.1 MarR family transcriptional regulator [Paenibacillus ginsengarvi]